MNIPLLSRWSLKMRREALMTEVEMHAVQIENLCHALIELSDPGDELAERCMDLLEALEP